MNIGRLVPQIVYYVYAYAQLVKTGEITAGQGVNFTRSDREFCTPGGLLRQANRSASWQADLRIK